jgi:hypothetical protein
MTETARRVRAPEDIIGKDALLQLVFEGYEVVPMSETIDTLAKRIAADASMVWEELEDSGSDGENKATYRRLARAQLIRPWHEPSRSKPTL